MGEGLLFSFRLYKLRRSEIKQALQSDRKGGKCIPLSTSYLGRNSRLCQSCRLEPIAQLDILLGLSQRKLDHIL